MSGGRSKGFPGVRRFANDPKQLGIEHADAINRINQGKINATGTVTLTASATSTTLTDSRIGADSFISLMPMTANAATALANKIHFTDFIVGQATINHASSADTDQDFRYVIIG